MGSIGVLWRGGGVMTLTWTFDKYKTAYLCYEDGSIAAYVKRLKNGQWLWNVLRYNMVIGVEPTRTLAMDAAQAAWLKHSEWVNQ